MAFRSGLFWRKSTSSMFSAARAPGRAFLRGGPPLGHVPGFVAWDQAQGAVGYEPAHGPAHRPGGQPDIACQPHKGKPEAEFAFQAAVAQEMRIDGALDDRKAQARCEQVFQ